MKLSGLASTLAVANRLRFAGVPFMIGQMSEDHTAIAAALQLCRVVQPVFVESYGVDGLTDSLVSGLGYRNGLVAANGPSGLDVQFNVTQARLFQEFTRARC